MSCFRRKNVINLLLIYSKPNSFDIAIKQNMILSIARSADPDFVSSDIPVKDLPRCRKNNCGALLRPDIVWFGEGLDSKVLDKARK